MIRSYKRVILMKTRFISLLKNNINYNFSIKNTDSPWVYSNIYDQLKNSSKGKIIIAFHPSSYSTHDITLRMYNQIFNSHLIITNGNEDIEKLKVCSLVEALLNHSNNHNYYKQKYQKQIKQQQQKQQQLNQKLSQESRNNNNKHQNLKDNIEKKSQYIQVKNLKAQDQILLINNQLTQSQKLNFLIGKQPKNYQQLYQMHIELSKHLSISQQVQAMQSAKQKSNKEKHRKTTSPSYMKKLVNQQSKISEYLYTKKMKQILLSFKEKIGYPPIFDYQTQIKGLIKKYYDNGLNMIFILNTSYTQKNRKILQQLQSLNQDLSFDVTEKEQKKTSLPYQILPIGNNLINTLVSAGFPADRFSVQKINNYSSQIKKMLQNRKYQSFTCAIQVNGQFLKQLVLDIIQVYGKQQKAFIQFQNQQIFRGQIHELTTLLLQHKINKQFEYSIIIAPYLPDFNRSMDQFIKQKQQIIGKATSKNTHFVQMEYLDKQYANLNKKQSLFSLDSLSFIRQVVTILGVQKSHLFLKKFVARALQNQININGNEIDKIIKKMINQAQQGIIFDYIGIQALVKDSKNIQKYKRKDRKNNFDL